jgi:hypothetical protein
MNDNFNSGFYKLGETVYPNNRMSLAAMIEDHKRKLEAERKDRVNYASESQAAYQETREAVQNALGTSKPLEANKARTVSAPLNSGPVNASNIRNFSPLAPPSNTQGNAKPLFTEEVEQKASMLAGNLDQANKVGY